MILSQNAVITCRYNIVVERIRVLKYANDMDRAFVIIFVTRY